MKLEIDGIYRAKHKRAGDVSTFKIIGLQDFTNGIRFTADQLTPKYEHQRWSTDLESALSVFDIKYLGSKNEFPEYFL